MQSEQIDQWAAAMAAAAAELRDVGKDGKNPHLRARYATLEACLAVVRPVLARHGLTVTQHLGGTMAEGERVTVRTLVAHASGQWVASEVGAQVRAIKGISIAQAAGQQVTYARRYALLAAVGVTATDEDTDAQPPPAPARRWSDRERAAYCARLGELGVDYDAMARWCEVKGRPRPSAMTPDQRRRSLEWLETLTPEARAGEMASAARGGSDGA